MPEGLRDRARRAVRAELAGVAMDLFERQGFDATTVDEIARAAGLTKRSFFRYFPAKEDAVFDGVDLAAERVVDDLRARPADEDPWDSLRLVLGAWQDEIHATERAVAGLRLIESTPSLLGRLHERRVHWRRHVGEALRRPGVALSAFEADLLTNVALAVLDAVSSEWSRTGADAARASLLDRGFELVRPDVRR